MSLRDQGLKEEYYNLVLSTLTRTISNKGRKPTKPTKEDSKKMTICLL